MVAPNTVVEMQTLLGGLAQDNHALIRKEVPSGVVGHSYTRQSGGVFWARGGAARSMALVIPTLVCAPHPVNT